jgi:outer membrane lipoprotein-sorting protein
VRIGLTFALFTTFLLKPGDAQTLDPTLNHLDHAGNQFKGMMADFKYVKHTAVVNEDSLSSGKIKLKKKPPDEILGLLDFTAPDRKIVSLNGKNVEIYLPNIKTVQKVDLGKHKGLVEQFILFGFGTSRSDLERAYNVTFGGPETIGGEATTRLVLLSRKPEVARQMSKFELWISDKTGQPVQQKFYEPSGDYNVFTYSDMKFPNLKDSDLELKHPKDVKTEIVNK